VPKDEAAESAAARAERRAWLAERDYAVIAVAAAEAESDMAGALDRLIMAVQQCQQSKAVIR